MKLFGGGLTIIIGWIIKLLAKMSWKKIIESILIQIAWKKLLYLLCTSVILPLLKKYVEDTESKWDDSAYNAVVMLVNMFLKPSETASEIAINP